MQQIFISQIWNALSWTLVHSLWQGLLLTIIVAAVLAATKKSAPAFRYSLLTALLCFFIAIVVITFIIQWQPNSPSTHTAIIPAAYDGSPQNNWWHTITGFMNQYSNWIIAIWAAIVCWKLVRLKIDLVAVNRLRTSGISHPEESWTIRLQHLADRMGIRKKIMLFESRLVNIPLVAGHFKPVILLPLGMLTQLSMDEVEAVLLHELAHIRRHDYIINLLQRVTGILLFFNPGVLWLSSLIRAERENCCDDIAITHTNDKLKFVEALISVKHHSLRAPSLAMNFLGQKNILLHRVNRILTSHNKSLSIAESGFVLLSIMAATIYFISVRSASSPPVHYAQAFSPIRATTHLPKFIDSKLDGAPISSSTPGSERPSVIINKLDLPPTKNKSLQATETKIEQESIKSLIQPEEMDKEKSLAAVSELDKARKQAELDRIQADKDRAAAELDRMQAEKDRRQAELDRKQAERDRLQADKDRAQADLDRKQAEKDRAQAFREAKAVTVIN
jgi:beta-lactamase regulating signal transducer with metallopeptidase domain